MLPSQAIVIALLLTVALPAAAEPGEVRRGIELPLPFGRIGQYRFESGDFDGDGAADLAYTSTEGTIPVWYHAGMFDPDARRVGPEGLSEESRMLLSPIPQGQPLPWDGVVRGAHDEDGDGFDDAFLLQDYDQTRLGVYRGSSAGLPADPSLVLEAEHGFRATVLDVDGDGFDDVVGAFNSNSHDIDTTTFFVWNGPLADGQAPTQLPPYTPESYTDWVNLDPFTSGDVDGDGYDDLVTSYSLAVWPGSDAGLETSPSATVWPWGGWSFNASTAVDVDGDGFVDVVTGVMPGWNNADGSIGPHPDEGNLFVFWGAPTSSGRIATWRCPTVACTTSTASRCAPRQGSPVAPNNPLTTCVVAGSRGRFPPSYAKTLLWSLLALCPPVLRLHTLQRGARPRLHVVR